MSTNPSVISLEGYAMMMKKGKPTRVAVTPRTQLKRAIRGIDLDKPLKRSVTIILKAFDK